MKKKGLIISTVVMAVVLIASLTTATYAWFSTSASTTVDSLSISVEAASDVAIGLASGSGVEADDKFYSGQVTIGGKQYADNGTIGMGTQLNIVFTGSDSSISLGSAIGTSGQETVATITNANDDDKFNPEHIKFTAPSSVNEEGAANPKTQSQLDTSFKEGAAAIARVNSDYIELNMGARAAKSEVYGIQCTLKVTTADGFTTLKDNAALHLYIVADGKAQDIDVFGGTPAGGSVIGNGTLKTAFETSKTVTISGSDLLVSSITYSNNDEDQAVATIVFNVKSAGDELAIDGTDIQPFTIYAFVWGPDPDCTSAGTGTTVSFDMSFQPLNSNGTVKTA